MYACRYLKKKNKKQNIPDMWSSLGLTGGNITDDDTSLRAKLFIALGSVGMAERTFFGASADEGPVPCPVSGEAEVPNIVL